MRSLTPSGPEAGGERLPGMDVQTDAPVELVATPNGRTDNRRTRLEKQLPDEMKAWLRRAAMTHAHLCYIVRLFGNPSKAGGTSLAGETFEARAARGDRTLLYDALGYCGEELAAIRAEVQAAMDAAPPTAAPPGSAEKVAVMVARAERGESIFIPGDAGISLE